MAFVAGPMSADQRRSVSGVLNGVDLFEADSANQLRLQRSDPRLQKVQPLLNDELDRVADKKGSSPQPNELLLIRQISPFLVRHRSTVAQPRDRTPQLDPVAWDQSG